MRTESFLRRMIAYVIICIQFLIPILSTQPLIAKADISNQNQSTIQGLNSLILGEGSSAAEVAVTSPPSVGTIPEFPAATTGETAIKPELPDLSATGNYPTPTQEEQQKPEMGRGFVEGGLASGFMQAGTLMSGDNRSEAAFNYARGVGEGLINQRVNDWLNQYGHAKVSVNTKGKITGDILFPLYDTDSSLLFSQMGVRTNKERNTANLGMGYRHYLGDWMLGVNSFYDDDYTGRNRRLGLGGEAWTDYLKLSINGYMRQTGWHQSRLQQMQDYDERPANGFDIRANAWLPSWPNVGGSLEYDQYFGRGVSIADSTSPDSLKNNPKIVKVGLNYTPFPLLTLSAKHAIGDARDTNIDLNMNYRFGVPWSEQMSPDSVDLMRSLTGSRYDLVDRNYDIVMQYRKQDLLRIHLPENIVAQAAETVALNLTVDRAKYGMKDVSWDIDPNLLANGGHYKIISPTELQITLPAYISTSSRKATEAQNYKIGAVSTDNHGNASNRAETQLSVIPSQNIVSSLVITPSGQALIANDQDSYTITGKVTDGKGAALVGQNITFSVLDLVTQNGDPGATLSSPDGSEKSNSKITLPTDSKGNIVALLRSTAAGDGTVNAKMDNGNSASVAASFVADSSTAAVHDVRLMDGSTRKVADGKNTFTWTVIVRDGHGNPVPGAVVTPAVDKKDVSVAVAGTTDANGQTTVTLTSTTTAVADITVSAQVGSTARVSADKTVSFIADSSKAAVTSVTLEGADVSKVADGKNSFTWTVTVKDTNGNQVQGATVTPTADKENVTVSAAGATDANGQTTVTLTSTTTAVADITVSAKVGSTASVSANKKVSFTADSSKAAVTSVALEGADVSKVADGKNAFTWAVTVKDTNGNRVQGATVTPKADKADNVTIATTGITDANGQTTVTLTSTTTAVADITVSAQVGSTASVSADKKVSFIADSSKALVTSVTLEGTDVSKVADGKNAFTLTVTVKDTNGNLVQGATVTPVADKENVTVAATGTTDANGQTTVTLTSTTTAVADITVSAKVGSTASVSADKKVSFIADSSKAAVSSVTLEGTDVSKVADGKNAFTWTVTVKDTNGNLVQGATVSPAADKENVTVSAVGTTDANGQTTVTLTSTTTAVADITVSAKIGSTASVSADKKVSFTADSSKAEVSSITLQDADVISKIADSKNAFIYTVIVKDTNGNLVQGATVTPKADKPGVTIKADGITNSDGQTTVTLTSSTTAVADITVSAQVGSTAIVSADKKVSFTADSSKAEVSSVTLKDASISKVADGKNSFTYTVTVTDSNGNPVQGATVIPKADKADNVTIAATGTTDANGQTTVTLTSTTTAVADITVSAQVGSTASVSADKKVSFTADSSNAMVSSVTLEGTDISKVADGKSAFSYTVIVKDANGNLVQGATVTPAADKENVSIVADGTTDANGQTTMTLTSSATAVADITVSAQVGSTASVSANKKVSFTADSSKALVTSVTLEGADVSKVADGKNTFIYTVIVKDTNDNLVQGATVTPAADKADNVTVAATGITDANGQTTITLTSTTTAVADITVSAQVSSTASVSANKKVSFTADSSKAMVSSVTLEGTDISKVADGKNAFSYTVIVKDTNGNLVQGATVTPATDKENVTVAATGITDANGQTTVTLTSSTTAVADITVSAQVGSTASVSANKKVSFTADSSKALVTSVTLEGTDVSKVADGKNAFTLTVTVKDTNGNLVQGATVTPVADKENVTVAATGITDANGQTTVTLTSTTAAVADITVSAQVGSTASVSADKKVSFTADSSKAAVSSVTLEGTDISKVADGKNAFSYTVIVKDTNGNLVQGATVTPAADKADNVTIAAAGTTDANGQTTVTLTSTTTAVADITLSAQVGSTASVSADKKVSFTADSSKALVTSVTLEGTDVSKVADGKNTFIYTVIVKDTNDNLVQGATVTPVADKENVTVAATGTTDANGQTTVTLTSTTTAVADITVSAQVGSTASVSADKKVSFIADSSKAAVSSVTLEGADVSKVADGKNTFIYTVIVKDTHGNLVQGATVTPAADKADNVTIAAAGTTDANGQTTVTLTGSTIAVEDITVSAQVGNTTSVKADKKVSFTANAHITVVSTSARQLIPADGKTENPLKITVLDTNNDPVKNYSVVVTGDENQYVTDNKGEITYSFKSSQPGADIKATATSVVDSSVYASLSTKFTIVSTTISSPF